ncbi:hypothetical protein [Psychrobacter sp. KCTC 72983]|uniref:hypothetical protein n=1 Tax=Psychrobacter sp. KCTC 72983 TaxID=2733866 RepID=UPI0016441C1D|nr:hypothetical protein [Psychrobacter sp. KCTC 72983]
MAKDKNRFLMEPLNVYHENSFSDMLALYARDIEITLRTAGAVVDEDYDYKMLMELAQPYVLALQKEKTLKLSVNFDE